jgi:hypothetical protein
MRRSASRPWWCNLRHLVAGTDALTRRGRKARLDEGDHVIDRDAVRQEQSFGQAAWTRSEEREGAVMIGGKITPGFVYPVVYPGAHLDLVTLTTMAMNYCFHFIFWRSRQDLNLRPPV